MSALGAGDPSEAAGTKLLSLVCVTAGFNGRASGNKCKLARGLTRPTIHGQPASCQQMSPDAPANSSHPQSCHGPGNQKRTCHCPLWFLPVRALFLQPLHSHQCLALEANSASGDCLLLPARLSRGWQPPFAQGTSASRCSEKRKERDSGCQPCMTRYLWQPDGDAHGGCMYRPTQACFPPPAGSIRCGLPRPLNGGCVGRQHAQAAGEPRASPHLDSSAGAKWRWHLSCAHSPHHPHLEVRSDVQPASNVERAAPCVNLVHTHTRLHPPTASVKHGQHHQAQASLRAHMTRCSGWRQHSRHSLVCVSFTGCCLPTCST